MKKYIIYRAIIFQLLFAGSLLSQTTDDTYAELSDQINLPRLYIGARYMPTFTKFEVMTIDNGTAETSFTMGYGAGGYLGINLSKNAALQAEVIYSALSQKYTDRNIERTVDLDYLYLPLLLVLNTGITRIVSFNIAAGPQLGINIGSRISAIQSNTDSVTAVLSVKTGDIGVAYGAGFDIRLGSVLSLDMGFRGLLGLVDISDDNQTRANNQYFILDRSYIRNYSAYAGLRLSF